MWGFLVLAFAAQIRLASSHAYLLSPVPRVKESDQPPVLPTTLTFGLKRFSGATGAPFNVAQARAITDAGATASGCGITPNGQFQRLDGADRANTLNAEEGPVLTNFTAGDSMTVKWRLSIPHLADNTNLGVRVAIIYPPETAGGVRTMQILAGMPNDGLTVVPGAPVVVAADAGPVSNEIETKSVEVRIPTKSCERCVLQWLWMAQNDGNERIDSAPSSDVCVSRWLLLGLC
jgi:hypothetical protein